MSLRWLSHGALMALGTGAIACASGRSSSSSNDPLSSYDPDLAEVAEGGGTDFGNLYRQMGLAASGAPILFVARAGSFATASPDTSIVLVGLSIPNRGLTFKHGGDGNVASYVVDVRLESDGVLQQQARDSETVRVPTSRETSRADESVIYRRGFRVPPGEYDLISQVKDVLGGRQSEQRLKVVVPRFTRPSVSTPFPAYEGSPRSTLVAPPNFLPSPRGSFVFGAADSANVYLESYGEGAPVILELRDQRDSLVWRGTPALSRSHSGAFASGVAQVPLARADMGVLTLSATRAGSGDTTRTALYLGFGPDLPVVSFGQMLSYLRFFTSPDKLRELASAPPSLRNARWADFLRSTDPDPTTLRNEAMEDYFVRIRDANETFKNDIRVGWLSDRGMVYVGLGEPAMIFDQYGYFYIPGDISNRSDRQTRLMIWDYPDLNAHLVFYESGDAHQWRLTPQGASIFRSLLSRKLRH